MPNSGLDVGEVFDRNKMKNKFLFLKRSDGKPYDLMDHLMFLAIILTFLVVANKALNS